MQKSAPSRPAPPPPKTKSAVKVFRAIYPYQAQSPEELSFDEGDLLYVIDTTDSWWKASCHGKTGLVPSNFVEESMETVVNPMHDAARRGNAAVVRECLANRVSVSSLDSSGSTPIHWAAHNGDPEVLKLLLSQPGAVVDYPNKLGDNALHKAAWKGNLEATRLLLENGANPRLLNKEGQSPYQLALNYPDVAAEIKVYLQPDRDSAAYISEPDSGDSD